MKRVLTTAGIFLLFLIPFGAIVELFWLAGKPEPSRRLKWAIVLALLSAWCCALLLRQYTPTVVLQLTSWALMLRAIWLTQRGTSMPASGQPGTSTPGAQIPEHAS